MFLHERTRKSLCRYGFVTLCLVPTCAVAIWAAVRNTEAHRNQCALELGRVLKLKVAIGGLEYPEPGACRYTNLIVADPVSDSPIARGDKVDVYSTQSALSIVAPKLTIELGAAGDLADLLHSILRDRSQTAELPLRLFVNELLVASPAGDAALQEFRAQIESTADGRRAHFTFRAGGMSKDSDPVALTIVRFRDSKTGVMLFTHGAFNHQAPGADAVVKLLRTLIAVDQVIVPASPEAEDLLHMPLP
jgi:hypothetical protein